MGFQSRGDVQLYYESTEPRAGAPILLSHGFGASTGMWGGQVEQFRETHQMISWDMRGHGLTECPNDPGCFSQAETVADMLAILDSNDVDRGVIAGHSLGGFMSLAFYVSHPDRVAALILQGCGPGYRSAESRARWNERAESRAVTIEEGGLEALGGGSEVGVSTQRSAQGLANAARGILSQIDSRVIDCLPTIRVPVLIVIGDGDTAFLGGSEYMAKKIPNVTEVVVAGAGHGVNIDQPDAVNAAFASFLGSL